MNLRPKKKAKAAPVPTHEPDITVKPEQELALLKILKSGSMFLGDIRRDIDLSPFVIAAILKAKPRVFVGWEDESGRYRVGLRSQLADAEKQADNRVQPESVDQKLAKLVEDAKWNGISTNRLWGRHRIPTKVSEDFQARHRDLVDLVEREDNQRRLKKFLVWKAAKKPPTEPLPVPLAQSAAFQDATSMIAAEPPQNAPTPTHAPTPEIALLKGELVHLLSSGPRGSVWLEQHRGIRMEDIRNVAAEFPEIKFRIEKRFNDLHSDFSISLAPAEPPPEPIAEKPAQSPPYEMPKFSPEEDARMHWKPGGHKVFKVPHPEHRERYPLVKL